MTTRGSSRRVVITGLGVVSPAGLDVPTLWGNVCNGRSAAGPVTRFDARKLPTWIAAEVKGFEPVRYMEAKRIKRCDRVTQYAIGAAVLAADDSGLNFAHVNPQRIGIVEGTTVSGMESMFEGQQTYHDRGYRGLSPFTVINAYCGEGASHIAQRLGLQAFAMTYCSGCASGNDAIGHAAQQIREDQADVMFAGATDDTLEEPMYGGFCALRVMSQRNNEPGKAMRPFSRDRDGFVLGEGAAFLVLEELSHALGRGARIYAEVLGHGRHCEAYHSTETHPDGIGFQQSIQKALRDAHLEASAVDYINAHGTATQTNDPIETSAIKAVFGPAAQRLAVSSTKPITGHMMGAAGAIESVICALAIQNETIPPTINFSEPADGCDLDYVPNVARPYPIRVAANLSAGFGGKNSCLLLGRFADS